MTEADRMKRAGNYVLGLMDDRERERAERDLEIDPSFRDAVVEVAARMHMFDSGAAPARTPEDGWSRLKDHIAGMPQMRPSAPPEPPVTPQQSVTFGRRRSDARRDAIAVPAAAPKVTRTGPQTVSNRCAVAIAAGLIAAFALGYLAGVSSSTGSTPIAASDP